MSRKYKGFSIIFVVLALLLLTMACVKTKTDIANEEDSTNKFAYSQKQNIAVPYEPTKFQAKVKPYKVNSDLSNIENSSQFGGLSQEQKELLAKNNFFVTPTNIEQLFYIYEDNEYKNIPSFITTDSVLQVYHIFYDYTLRNLEEQKLLAILEELTDNMLKNSISIYDQIKDEEIKEIQLKNIAFFSVGELCLEKELIDEVPKKAKDLALKEFEEISNHRGFKESNIFPYELDYSQYIPRGHYTRSEDFEKYFKAMMWYGQAPFPLYFIENEVKNIEQTIQALLITYSIYSDKENYNLWEQIYEPTNFFVGSSDDLGIYEYGDLLFKIYGNKPDLNQLKDEDKLDELYEEAKKFPEPKIKPKYTTVTTPVGKQFRFMGQRYVLDAEIIQELVEPIIRPVPSGLDVMGVLGSEKAKEIQMEKEINQYWDEYPKEFERLKDKFGKFEDSQWRTNMYQGWLWTLKGLLKPYGKGYPSFMTNKAWVDKNLTTALASWAELKHDTILYGKQSGAEMGGGGYEEPIGYVEPNIEVYEKLLWLTKFSKENLKERNLLIENIEDKIEKFEDLLEFLIHASVKQLNNEELTEKEYYRIIYYGGYLEGLSCSFVEGDLGYWHEITSDTDRNMALIADFHTIAPNSYSPGGYLEVAVGPASEIYVIVPIGGKLYLSRGAVFSYYEFISNERLTDEKWQEMLKEEKVPAMPEWTNSFIREGKVEIPYPEYN
ncbi:DUF3160 domain-containing protein [Clostridium sp. Cult2]|uniref:DUF3160 domain-containing protein n=1 Tax=Clostridium sp. Cult2 TaxID=2079003 RepID=UPI001F397059|nr:DUF3160 domain-containing protein [Clostridium sp. Cult2]MCF6464292.1 hypothetical protein [Clostridium sp. Cult2]